ncbi:MAG: transglutaminase domain-containing protein [Deltaproteobacteria bacterium]
MKQINTYYKRWGCHLIALLFILLIQELTTYNFASANNYPNDYYSQVAEGLVDQQMALYANEKAAFIIDEIITEDMSDENMEKAIHDYIVTHCEYDKENYMKNTIPKESYNAFGVLVLGKGVCQGYAEATKMLCDKAGLQCKIISGEARDENQQWAGHAWNLIQLNGKWYHLDTTWDDPISLDEKKTYPNKVSYTYYNLTDDEMDVSNHRWDRGNYPIADTHYTKVFEMGFLDKLMIKIHMNPEDEADTKKFYGCGLLIIVGLLVILLRK